MPTFDCKRRPRYPVIPRLKKLWSTLEFRFGSSSRQVHCWRFSFHQRYAVQWRRSAMTKDYYAILGVPRAADTATIHSAFRARARQYHPDAGTESSTPKFREALEAYHTLSNPQRRRQYDVDLGTPLAQSRVMPEPLFSPQRSRPTSISPMSS